MEELRFPKDREPDLVCASSLAESPHNVLNDASHYDPFITGVITLLAAAIVIAIWEPKTLSRLRADAAPAMSDS
jgi:hypothetical protein